MPEDMNGLLVIDKPGGCTSSDVCLSVKRKLGAGKVGHLGTLDPMATGVLPLVINRATRYADHFSGGSKEYSATMKLGEETDTYDREGRVVRASGCGSVKEGDIEKVLKGFLGKIKQIPPMFSAVKKDGVPLYKLARRGMVVDRAAKDVEVYSVDVISVDMPYVSFRVSCSRGTYLRTLCYDAGRMLCCGAHLTGLRRTKSGRFTDAGAISPHLPRESLFKNIIPLEVLLGGLTAEVIQIPVFSK